MSSLSRIEVNLVLSASENTSYVRWLPEYKIAIVVGLMSQVLCKLDPETSIYIHAPAGQDFDSDTGIILS